MLGSLATTSVLDLLTNARLQSPRNLQFHGPRLAIKGVDWQMKHLQAAGPAGLEMICES